MSTAVLAACASSPEGGTGIAEGARRRGKYLWLPLDSGDALLGHLGMSGQMLVQPAAVPDERHLRVRLRLDSGAELRFVDQRMFGGLALSSGGAGLPPEMTSPPNHIRNPAINPMFGPNAVSIYA